jgi:hypothetical protein
MAKNQNRRLSPKKLLDARRIIEGLEHLPGFIPLNKQYSLQELRELVNGMEQARDVERKDDIAAKNSRGMAIASEWRVYNAALGTRSNVVAQYGRDADELRLVGVKKESERRSPKRHMETKSGNGQDGNG